MPFLTRIGYFVRCSGTCGSWLSTACTPVDRAGPEAEFREKWDALKAAYGAGWLLASIGGPVWQGDPICPECRMAGGGHPSP